MSQIIVPSVQNLGVQIDILPVFFGLLLKICTVNIFFVLVIRIFDVGNTITVCSYPKEREVRQYPLSVSLSKKNKKD